VEALALPRLVWVMVPAGAPTESVIAELAGLLSPGDVIIDGGNTHYKDDARRASELGARGLAYLDAGVSGGIWGRELGYCLMVGGESTTVARLAPVFTALAPAHGWLHVGAVGSGHYVKMIHNGVEYGMMQAYAEGFELMSVSDYGLDLAAIAGLWNRGSVVRSWLLELTADVLATDPKLSGVRAWVEDSGEGRWTVADAVDKAVPAPALTAALFARFRSRREDSFADRLLAALRRAFGGHAVRR
jgi:6-phosphogluconate dehydrogenase